ncbi:hypothetical protein MUY27_07235 [Mucilaginibacter sp. RS28]|uniref:DNA mismatch repair proteins mutS family domain-containing protein n=1 Tax=Mucilaginibacter straminoryzae TaxID=2932774 RepID=A0A9X1X1H3_9SPHI|nr:hypothetical protein [Mucilaginibacter straminoryzae]MCJ8209497.1 hypothetical protein [Mucilaginibacter straminoryzae]
MILWLILVPVIIAIISVINVIKQRAKQKALIDEIVEGWGKPKNENFDFKKISAYYNRKPLSALSDALANDIDLEKLFEFIDRTNSRPGQQYLYDRLRGEDYDLDELKAFDAAAEQLVSDPQKRLQVCLLLHQLDHKNAYFLPELFLKKATLIYADADRLYIRFSWIIWLGLVILLAITHHQIPFILLLFSTLYNLYLHYTNKNKIAAFVSSLPQLKQLIKSAKALVTIAPSDQHPEVEQALKTLVPINNGLGLITLDGRAAGDQTDLGFALWELVKILLLVEPRVFINAIDKVNAHAASIEVLYRYVGYLDVVSSAVSLMEGLHYYSKPDFNKDGVFTVEELYHPLIADCSSNSITVRADRGVLITGSNMSGKTTFIRAVAVNTLLAQTLYVSVAKQYRAPLLKLCTSIRTTDDLQESVSYFQAEATAIHGILEAGNKGNCLIIIDEIFKGTNTIERVAASKAILSYLTSFPNFVFVSTHDLELAELLGDEYEPYSFEETAADTRLIFDYKIKPGILKRRNAIAVLQSAGYPSQIIDNAYKLSEELSRKYS